MVASALAMILNVLLFHFMKWNRGTSKIIASAETTINHIGYGWVLTNRLCFTLVLQDADVVNTMFCEELVELRVHFVEQALDQLIIDGDRNMKVFQPFFIKGLVNTAHHFIIAIRRFQAYVSINGCLTLCNQLNNP